MKHKIFSLFLALAASILTITASDKIEIDGIYYLINTLATQYKVLVSYRGDYPTEYPDEYSGDIVIPSSINYNGNTYTVTSISSDAFAECTGLTSVVIPNTVTDIDYNAFWGCTALISAIIPNSVRQIGNSAFSGCTSLTSVSVPNSVTKIEYNAFFNVPNVVYDGEASWPTNNTWWGAKSLNGFVDGWLVYSDESKTKLLACSTAATGEITIPSSVTEIGEKAFRDCVGITSITIGNSVTTIGEWAFAECTGLTSVVIPESVIEIGGYAFWNCLGLTSVTIGSSVTTIGDNAFSDCTGLTSVIIPNSVTTIGSSAFAYCRSLLSIEIPNSVTSIGDWAFEMMPNISYFGDATGSPWGARSVNGYIDGWLVYSDDAKTNLLSCSFVATGAIEIPNSVTNIQYSAFVNCKNVTSITIPNSVESIGYSAFSGCSDLTGVNIPNRITSIENWTFSGCISLISIEIPHTITSIGNYAFYSCRSLTSIEIPNGVTSIGERAFFGCRDLTTIICEAVIPPDCMNGVFGGDGYNPGLDKSICLLYVPFDSMDEYKEAYQWIDFGDNIQPIQAPEVPVTEIEAEPTDNSVVIEWPEVTGATEYIIQIWKGEELICTLSFNEIGQLLSISFDKKAGKNTPKTAAQTATGWQYTIGGLEAGTEYTYIVTAKNGETELFKDEKQFTTTMATAIDEIINDKMNKCENAKIIIGGHLFILRDGVLYNVHGARVE